MEYKYFILRSLVQTLLSTKTLMLKFACSFKGGMIYSQTCLKGSPKGNTKMAV